jgi:LssY C-terminus
MTIPVPSRRWRFIKRAAIGVLALLLVYVVVAYVLLPLGWVRYAHRHPAWEDAPRVTHTVADIPGDPINVALVGTETEVKKIMLASGWYPADALTLKSCLGMAEAAVLKRTYDDAPVSNLFLFGRKEDLAFEQPVGDNPRKRHHVRFWQWDKLGPNDSPVWFGSATYDERVGLSHTTGEVTHHIAPDIDTERDHLMRDLERTGELTEVYAVDGFQKDREGRNGGGDPWHTDGNLSVAVIKPPVAGSHP